MPHERKLDVLGWREWLSLPDLEIDWVKAKVDTGARSSSLHAYDITTEKKRGRTFVCFKVHPLQRDTKTVIECRAPLLEYRTVRSSNGRADLRPVVRTTLHLGDTTWPIDLTLAARDMMGFRMLLGREAVRGRFLIDPGRSFLIGDRPRKRRSKRGH